MIINNSNKQRVDVSPPCCRQNPFGRLPFAWGVLSLSPIKVEHLNRSCFFFLVFPNQMSHSINFVCESSNQRCPSVWFLLVRPVGTSNRLYYCSASQQMFLTFRICLALFSLAEYSPHPGMDGIAAGVLLPGTRVLLLLVRNRVHVRDMLCSSYTENLAACAQSIFISRHVQLQHTLLYRESSNIQRPYWFAGDEQDTFAIASMQQQAQQQPRCSLRKYEDSAVRIIRSG